MSESKSQFISGSGSLTAVMYDASAIDLDVVAWQANTDPDRDRACMRPITAIGALDLPGDNWDPRSEPCYTFAVRAPGGNYISARHGPHGRVVETWPDRDTFIKAKQAELRNRYGNRAEELMTGDNPREAERLQLVSSRNARRQGCAVQTTHGSLTDDEIAKIAEQVGKEFEAEIAERRMEIEEEYGDEIATFFRSEFEQEFADHVKKQLAEDRDQIDEQLLDEFADRMAERRAALERLITAVEAE
jgi:hypothetical protein